MDGSSFRLENNDSYNIDYRKKGQLEIVVPFHILNFLLVMYLYLLVEGKIVLVSIGNKRLKLLVLKELTKKSI